MPIIEPEDCWGPYSPENSDTVQSNWQGAVIFAACLGIPLLGCVLAVYFQNMSWLVLLAPLIVFMEGAFVLGGLAWFVVALLINK